MLHAIVHFIRYYLRADTKYRVHSPSLFSFVEDVIETNHPYYCYKSIEIQRTRLLNNQNTIEVVDLGAGSNYGNSNKRKIAKIAATAVSSKSKCELLHRIATLYKPQSILELGTSLGISASYLAHVANTTTIEGSEGIAKVAQSVFDAQGLKVDLRVGDISDVLDLITSEGLKFDIIYADGNHRKQPTIDYFNQMINMLTPNGVILFDDIYWSKGMTEAWNHIKADSRTARTIDLYTFGIVEVGRQVNPDHKTLIKSTFKPFQWGFFSGSA